MDIGNIKEQVSYENSTYCRLEYYFSCFTS